MKLHRYTYPATLMDMEATTTTAVFLNPDADNTTYHKATTATGTVYYIESVPGVRDDWGWYETPLKNVVSADGRRYHPYGKISGSRLVVGQPITVRGDADSLTTSPVVAIERSDVDTFDAAVERYHSAAAA